jgi:hypothetical protein
MMQSLCLLAALAAPAADADDLAKALRAATGADGYAFTVRENGGAEVEGKYQKGRPVSLRADRIDFFKKGDALVYKQADGWHKAKTGTLSDPLAILGASAKARGTRLPGDELAGLEKRLRNLKKSEEKGQVVYGGDLTEEGAKALAKSEDREVARGGTAKLWLDDKGRPARYEITIRLKGRRGNAEVDGEAMKAVTLKELGAAKVEVPDAVKKLLE